MSLQLVILNFGCTLESPGELQIHPSVQVTPQTKYTKASGEAQAPVIFKIPRLVAMSTKAENHCCGQAKM